MPIRCPLFVSLPVQNYSYIHELHLLLLASLVCWGRERHIDKTVRRHTLSLSLPQVFLFWPCNYAQTQTGNAAACASSSSITLFYPFFHYLNNHCSFELFFLVLPFIFLFFSVLSSTSFFNSLVRLGDNGGMTVHSFSLRWPPSISVSPTFFNYFGA